MSRGIPAERPRAHDAPGLSFYGGMLWSAPMKKALVGSLAVLLVAGLGVVACKKSSPPAPKTTPEGLVVEDVKVGDGALATPGRMASVHYTGRLTDGTKFDSSYDHGQPIEFPLGTGKVIKGWDMGIQGMKVGGKRKLTIPPDLAYGAQGTPGGPIPPNATLVFDVELTGVQ